MTDFINSEPAVSDMLIYVLSDNEEEQISNVGGDPKPICKFPLSSNADPAFVFCVDWAYIFNNELFRNAKRLVIITLKRILLFYNNSDLY